MTTENAIGRFSGIAVECPDPNALAEFYAAITGWTIVYTSDTWVSIGESSSTVWHLSFQRSPAYAAPIWPDPASSMQFHLHFRVTDIEAATRSVLALGGTLFADQPNETGSRVFADPAGHPFCLCWHA